MTDAQGNVIDEGTIDAYYDGEELQLNMSNRSETGDIGDYLSMNTKLTYDFLNYPDDTIDYFTLDNSEPFRFDAADYTVQIGERPRDFMHIKISNRNYVGDEKITTPAGDFSAKKSTFTLEVYNHDTRARDTYHGTEWYADGEGIVRTEIADGNGHLVDYSEIVEIYTRE